MERLKEVIDKNKYYCNEIKSYAVPLSVLEDFIKYLDTIDSLVDSMKLLGQETQKLKQIVDESITRNTDQIPPTE